MQAFIFEFFSYRVNNLIKYSTLINHTLFYSTKQITLIKQPAAVTLTSLNNYNLSFLISSQVNLYLFEWYWLWWNWQWRKISFHVFPWFVALVWGASLVLFEYEQETMHPSLSASMTYIFHDSEHWTNFWDLFVYNTLLQ